MTADGLGTVVVVLALFCLWHASATLGIRPALAFIGIAVVTSWVFEQTGVMTGLVYGPYHYTTALGPWVGSVPALIPLAWFALAYATFTLVDLVSAWWAAAAPAGRGRAVGGVLATSRGGGARVVGSALVAAFLMAAWDLLLDPILSGPVYRAWTWGAGPSDAGVPLQNSVGWFGTAFAIFLLYGVLRGSGTRRRVVRP
jgi:uncharacterized membrane protein